jgi:hypothetical protein
VSTPLQSFKDDIFFSSSLSSLVDYTPDSLFWFDSYSFYEDKTICSSLILLYGEEAPFALII